jgi:hypothetical protein
MAPRKLIVEPPTPKVFVHGSKLNKKALKDKSLKELLPFYRRWKERSLGIKGREEKDIKKLTNLLNEYKNAVEPILDARSNSAQEVLQPSIIEEFFEYLFCSMHACMHGLSQNP